MNTNIDAEYAMDLELCGIAVKLVNELVQRTKRPAVMGLAWFALGVQLRKENILPAEGILAVAKMINAEVDSARSQDELAAMVRAAAEAAINNPATFEEMKQQLRESLSLLDSVVQS